MKTFKLFLIRTLALPFVMAGSLIFAIVKWLEFSFMFIKNGGQITAIYSNKNMQEKERKEFVNQIADAVIKVKPMKTFLSAYWYCLTFKNVRDAKRNRGNYFEPEDMWLVSMMIWFITILILFAIYKILA